MDKPPVRTITLGIAEQHPLSFETIQRAGALLRQANARYSAAGYEVQTVRISTRPIFDDLAQWSDGELVNYIQGLQRMLDEAGLAFCSVGPAQAARANFPLQRIGVIADHQRKVAREFSVSLAIKEIDETVIVFRDEDGYARTMITQCDAPVHAEPVSDRTKSAVEVLHVQTETSQLPFDAREEVTFFARLMLFEVENVAFVAIDEFGYGGI